MWYRLLNFNPAAELEKWLHRVTDLKLENRNLLVEALREELLGPANGPFELIDQRPSSRYLIGRLAPANTQLEQQEDEGLAAIDGDGGDDGDAGMDNPIANVMNPSSIGLSFVVASGVEAADVVFKWGEYAKIDGAANIDDDGAHALFDAEITDDLAIEDDKKGIQLAEEKEIPQKGARPVTRYRRTERVSKKMQVATTMAGKDKFPVEDASGIVTRVQLWYVTKPLPSGDMAVSVFMVNRNDSPKRGERISDEVCIFQPEIVVSGANSLPIFRAREMGIARSHVDDELKSLELLYWDRPEFAVGHGCSASWSQTNGERSASTVQTVLLPQWELPRVDPLSNLPIELSMDNLGGTDSDGVSSENLVMMLNPLADCYEQWINDTLKPLLNSSAIPGSLLTKAKEHIARCEKALQRIREGIGCVASKDEFSRRAFCFANRAMALQRRRTLIALARRRGELEPLITPPTWRPFQLAFILVSIASLADRSHVDRKTVDLLWFPTGGGKTEAYLGLTAFALAHRRQRPALDGYRNDVGVTVLMRYTLRLLTIQQFQRAAALICCCEAIRVDEGAWGNERFSIGLWVGRSATPNSYDNEFAGSLGAKQILEKLRQREPGGPSPRGSGTPLQLLACPWCGAEITVDRDKQNVYGDDDREVVVINCSDATCRFSPSNGDGIPAHVVDQELYRFVPSLIIATVDKFAQMPFNGRIQSFFGKVERHCPRHGFLSAGEGSAHSQMSHNATATAPAAKVTGTLPLEPPDLIIQDELHLISGPLGTMVGAYESAVDFLSSVRVESNSYGPKVIASTATVRRADRQVGALFNRRLSIFPPLGLRASDSWFGQELPTSLAAGRMYVGVYGPGKSVKTALVRVYASLLSRAEALLKADATSADPYMTLVGYYNSLRELGGAIRLLEDDVPARVRVLNSRDPSKWSRRFIKLYEQLTSNKSSEEVPEILKRLELSFSAEAPKTGRRPYDVLLASNMISVGVDIDRLGLMVVTGQPKTTAEYIQATSRVGRQSPGLVVCVYNWSRPRDTSHYERFRSYHSSLYKFVEATSVTPFSSRARDKALQGVLSAMIRLGDFAMTPEANADKLDRASAHVRHVLERLESRSGQVAEHSGQIAQAVSAATFGELASDLDEWEATYQHGNSVSWTKAGLGVRKKGVPPNPKKRFLITKQEDIESDLALGPFVAPSSLREVESEVHVYLVDTSQAVIKVGQADV